MGSDGQLGLHTIDLVRDVRVISDDRTVQLGNLGPGYHQVDAILLNSPANARLEIAFLYGGVEKRIGVSATRAGSGVVLITKQEASEKPGDQ